MHGESPGQRGDQQQQAGNDDAIVARQRVRQSRDLDLIGLSAAGAS